MNYSEQEILQRIRQLDKDIDASECSYHGFLRGTLGILYYYYNRYLITAEEEYFEKADSLLKHTLADLNENANRLIGPSFADGGAGLAFLLSYLYRNSLIDINLAQELSFMDDYLFKEAVKMTREDKIDYLHGSLGVLLYFFERRQTKKVKKYFNDLFDELYARLQFTENGSFFRNAFMGYSKDNIIDLSLSHGMSGAMLILLKVYPKIEDKERTRKIIHDGMNFLFSCRKDPGESIAQVSQFPIKIHEQQGSKEYIDRLAWCYGDLNQVLLFYRAGKFFRKREWVLLAHQVGQASSRRIDHSETLCQDAGFCHGTAGLAIMYKALHKETSREEYAQCYRYWLHQTITELDKGITTNHAGPGLLEGLSGTSLVLTDYLNKKSVNWTGAFLL